MFVGHKCEHYWTDHEGEEKQFGMATIRLLKASVVCPDFLVRTMQLRYKKDDSVIERTVCQFHYSAWPDHGVPPLVRPLLDMVRLVRDTQASETLPVLIHCSAGCGRTGTICAIDYVWGLLRAGKLTRDFSLLKLVRDMRKQRIAMVQTKDQYVLVHKAVRELFQEQLKMIDAHPYENVDINGIPLMKIEPTYESIRASEMDEKQDNKEKEGISSGSQPCDFLAEQKVVIVDIPPLPIKKSCSNVAPSKHEKDVENQTQRQLSGISVWSTNYEVTKCEPHYHIPSPSVGYSSTGDSGLSASSTDSSSTITSEKLPKRCPLPLPLAETVASSSTDQNLVVSLAVHQDDSSSSNSPSISSLLHKPRIAKLKALFERSSSSKSSKSRSGKPVDESDFSLESPKTRTSQQVTRSHSLGAVRKPNKFSQFQTASETPVALYRKLFSTKENKETNLAIKKGTQTETYKSLVKEGKDISSSSSSSTGSIANVKNEPLCSRNSKVLLDVKPLQLENTSTVLHSSSSSKIKNLYHPTPHHQDHKPVLPIKRSKSLKVVGNVDHSYFSTTQNYAILPSQVRNEKTPMKKQVTGDEHTKLLQDNLGGSHSTLQMLPVPRERQKKNLDMRLVDCSPSSYQLASSKVLQPCSKMQAARLSSVPTQLDYVQLNGSAHPIIEQLETSAKNYHVLHTRQANDSGPCEHAPYSNVRCKEYVNITELKGNWHEPSIESPLQYTANASSNRLKDPSHVQYAKQTSNEELASSNEQTRIADHKSTSLDESTQKIIDDCRKYLLISHDPGCSQAIPDDESLQSEQYDSLSLEAQRKINTIVGGIGIRERRNSFRKAVCHDGDAANKSAKLKRNLKDYEPIWLQSESGIDHNHEMAEQHWTRMKHNEMCKEQNSGIMFSKNESVPSPPKPRLQNSASSSALSSLGSCSTGNGGKRPPDMDNNNSNLAALHNPTYHSVHLTSSWDSATSSKPDEVFTQCQQLQQRAVTKAMNSRFPVNFKSNPPPNMCAETFKNDPIAHEVAVTTNCNPAFKREVNNVDSHVNSQQRGAVQMQPNSGPLAPPRIKRHSSVPPVQQQQHQNTGMFNNGDLGRSDHAAAASVPLYVNTNNIKSAKDGWHGAPGVDVDTVAASIKKTAQNDSSTPLTRAFGKLHSKASNFRTKLSPKNDADGSSTANVSEPDTRQQGHNSSKVCKNLKMPMPQPRKQQQYL
ncbi:hypothetical protein B566_EDAN010180 [Ephemera danica]|nr:hypothetical protein B566_EDAN010180 [Ephemera danica]